MLNMVLAGVFRVLLYSSSSHGIKSLLVSHLTLHSAREFSGSLFGCVVLRALRLGLDLAVG